MNTDAQSTLTRLDYIQVGLTSKNAMKLIRRVSASVFEVAIGDHSGSLNYFQIRMDTNQIETIFKTLPGPNAKITCIEAYSGLKPGGSTKILIVYGPSMIKGFNKKGKQFFALELNNLTEPIKMFRMHRTPDEIHVLGQYIYNSYLVNTELVASSSSTSSTTNLITPKSNAASGAAYNSVVRSRHYYVCPAQINDFVLMQDRFNRRTVPVLACQDRLLRLLKDSNCNFEVEVCGIPSVLQLVPKRFTTISPKQTKQSNEIEQEPDPNDILPTLDYFVDDEQLGGPTGFNSDWNQANNKSKYRSKSTKDADVNLCYGTMDGKIALVTFQFMGREQLEPLHHWEVPLGQIKQPVTCLVFSETQPEFYVGRSDGSVEIWRLNESIEEGEVEQQVDLSVPPSLTDSYNCSESITNLVPILVGERQDLLLLCATFTGLVFGLHQHGQALQMRQFNPNYLMISKENADRIRSLQEECQRLEKQLQLEQKNYAKHTAKSEDNANSTSTTAITDYEGNLSVLPFFAINDSFVLHNDASYILMLEVEVSIDVVVLHCDLPLDLIDCERNSAVISFNDDSLITSTNALSNMTSSDQVLVTFRCQSNTSRLEIRLRPVEGQQGTMTVYVISRITPKCCQRRTYEMQPLSLHKRQYSHTGIEHANRLTITGSFGLNDAHTWLRLCIPEIPEKLSPTISDVESEVFYYVSTMTESILICNCGRAIITMSSDNVSSISILKDFITRQATRQSIEIGIEVDLSDKSLATMLARIYPNIKQLIKRKHRQDLLLALADLQSIEADIAGQLLNDLNLNNDQLEPVQNQSSNREDVVVGLDRLYGIITDLFIDYHKLKNSSMITSLVAMAKNKLPDMIDMIESIVLDSFDSDHNQQATNDMQLHLETNRANDGHQVHNEDKESDIVLERNTSPFCMNNQQGEHVQTFINSLFQFWNIPI